MPWGSDTTNESKPDWVWLTAPGRANSAPKSANVFATGSGWVHKWPWGNEVLVAIGNLASNLGTATLAALYAALSAPLSKATGSGQTVAVAVDFNEAVLVTGTPTVVAIQAAANVANVTLTYSSADSEPEQGRLVFKNAAVDLTNANVGGTLTVNSTSVVTGWDGITDAGDASVVANGVPSGVSLSITIGA